MAKHVCALDDHRCFDKRSGRDSTAPSKASHQPAAFGGHVKPDCFQLLSSFSPLRFCMGALLVSPCILFFAKLTMLQPNLVYTGVTRGKSLVVLVGTTKAVAIAVNRADATRRCCGLKLTLTAVATLA